MKINNCPICNHKRIKYFEAQVLRKYEISYLFCTNCGLLQTENPYWLDEAYSNAIADTDLGLVSRNLRMSKRLACILYFLLEKNGSYLDIAGGYGLLTRLMRDIGFDFYWSDIYCQNIFAQGFDIVENKKSFSGITAFEVLEHVYDPIEFIKNSLKDAKTSTIIFSTELFQGSPPELEKWWYYALESGQHISFYQPKTLKFIADKLSLNLYSFKSIHMLTNRQISKDFMWQIVAGRISNILYEYVKFIMKSKTLIDYETMKSQVMSIESSK